MNQVRVVLVLLCAGMAVSGTPGQSNTVPDHGRLQAQVEASSESTLYFPDYVDGGGWSVQLALSNAARRATASIVVAAFDQEGRPVPELFDSETAFQIPPLGSRVLSSAGTGQIRRGWIEVRTDPPSVSGLLTYRNSESGVEVGVAPVELGDRFALFVEETSGVGAGLAVYKPDPDSRIELRIQDESGMDPVGGALIRGDFHQSARTLSEWFDMEGIDRRFLQDFRGLLLLRTEDESGFAPLGLRFGKGTGALSAVPLIRDQTREAGERSLIFPDYVEGGGWSVSLALSNVDPNTAAEAVVTAHDQEGRLVPRLFDSDGEFEIPSLGSRVLRSSGAGQIRRGWIQVRTGTPGVSGSLIYGHTGTGVEVGVAPVELGNHFALFVEETGEVGAGLAVYKPDPDSQIELRLRDESGRDPLDDLFIPRRDFRQSARTISEWFDADGVDGGFLRDFRGLLFLRTADGSPFAPLGLRFGKGTGALSAVPVIRIVAGDRIDGGMEIEGGVGIDGGGHAPPPTVTLSVSPNSIDRGQSTMLRWSSTNAESAEITPGIGDVATSGTRRVSPTRTTTYRITVRGADGQTATESVTVTVAVSERQALEALYEATDGPNWVNNENWLTDAPLGEWFGVTTNLEGRVVSLEMSYWDRDARQWISNNLSGPIPPELGYLTSLEYLQFFANNLTGPIPPELGKLANLTTLDFNANDLSGSIPPELEGLTKLTSLNLNSNDLSGPIPRWLGGLANLTLLWLASNQLTGPIPPELGNLVNLRSLSLNDNNLTGEIPDSFLQLDMLKLLQFQENAGLCSPRTGAFDMWLAGMDNWRGPRCGADPVAGPVPNPRRSPRTVRVIYAVPADRSVSEIYRGSIQAAIENVQRWYQSQLGDGRTFRLYDSQPEVCELPHPEAWYAKDAWHRLLTGGLRNCAPVESGRKTHLWVVYADIDEPCPGPFELGRGWNGLTMLGQWDLRGLTDRSFTHCGTWSPPLGRWHGGLAHEITHTFNVPHPPGCDEGLPTCDKDALMWSGYARYPDTYLRDDEKAILLASPFIVRPP